METHAEAFLAKRKVPCLDGTEVGDFLGKGVGSEYSPYAPSGGSGLQGTLQISGQSYAF